MTALDTTLRYESPSGDVVRFAPGSSFHYTGSSLHDWKRSYASTGERITAWTEKITDYELDAVVAGTAEDRNRLFEVMERDALLMTPGRLWCGDYYLVCYVTASDKSDWWQLPGWMHAKLTITAERPVWTRESSKLFGVGVDADADVGGIDYPRDYPYDYVSNIAVSRVHNTGIVPAPFRMTVYGPVAEEHVEVVVGTNVYAVDVQPADGEILTIDSRDRTIVLRRRDGTEENVFGKRVGEQVAGSGSYVFEGIEPGDPLVSWPGTFKLGITVYDERMEPRW